LYVQVRLTALYLGLCAIVIGLTIGPNRALDLRHRYAARAASTTRDVRLPSVSTGSRVALHPASEQAKPRGERMHPYQLPIGTLLSVRLRTPIGSASSSIDDQVDATLAEAVSQEGVELIPEGSLLHGRVVDVVAASKKVLHGQIAVSFAVVQHAHTRSRAAIRTLTVTIAAEDPEAPPQSRRRSRAQPVDLALPAGHMLVLTLADPLIVYIPTAAPAREAVAGSQP
jgi:hypothetical protein